MARADERLRTIQVLLGEVARQRSDPARSTFESAADFLAQFTYKAMCAMRTVTEHELRIARLEAAHREAGAECALWRDRYERLFTQVNRPKAARKSPVKAKGD